MRFDRHRLLAIVRRVAWSGVRIYILLVCILYLIQSWLVYHPMREMGPGPQVLGLPCRDLWLTTADGLKLFAWYIPADRPIGTVLHCHGNAGNISHRIDLVLLLRNVGLNVLIFDYRGYGRSEGRPSEGGTYLDAEAAWRHLTEELGVPPQRIVIHGQSLGAAVAAHLAGDHAPGALVLESAFANMPDLAAGMLWFLPVRWMSKFRYDTAGCVAAVRCPVLVVHSRDDELIPFRHGRRVFEAASGPKEFLEIRGSHNEGFYTSRERYEAGLRAFLAQHLGRLDGPGGRPVE